MSFTMTNLYKIRGKISKKILFFHLALALYGERINEVIKYYEIISVLIFYNYHLKSKKATSFV